MLRTGLADRLRDRELAEGYLRPDYDEYSFHRVPGTLANMLDVDVGPALPEDATTGVPDAPSTVVLLFIDALGWSQFSNIHTDVAFFDKIGTVARVTPLTSVYPSETAACVPTVHTGTTPREHGMLGWDAYDPEADVVYTPLPFQSADGGDLSLDRDDLFDGDQIYQRLRDAGVETHAISPAEHHDSGIQVDADFHGYFSIGAFATTLRETIDTANDPAYVYAYYPGIDGVAHREGPTSNAHDAQLDALGSALERELSRVESPGDVLLCLVADHGQVTTPPSKNAVLPDDVIASVRRDRSGSPIITGGPRNIHLHLRDDVGPATVQESLSNHEVLVLTKEMALAEELWGPGAAAGPAFDRNCGDVIVIPRTYSMWWNPDTPEHGLEGMHGGLHADEALVPFAPVRLSDIV